MSSPISIVYVAATLLACLSAGCAVDDRNTIEHVGIAGGPRTIFVGDTDRLSVGTDDPTSPVFWVSGNTAVVTVDERTGLVTGIAPGATAVTAVYGVEGTVLDVVTVTILEPMTLLIDAVTHDVFFYADGAVDLRIEWGDGSIDHVTEPGPVSHRYAAGGRYEVRLKGTLQQFGNWLHASQGIAGVVSWGDLGLESLSGAFLQSWYVETIPTSLPVTVNDLSWMFAEAENFDHLYDVLAGWSVDNVDNLAGMFMWTGFDADVSRWNVSRVTDMQALFAEGDFRGDISGWDVSNVADMSWLFYNTSYSGDLSAWDVANVVAMEAMFGGAIDGGSTFNGDITGWDVSRVRVMRRMFAENATFDQDISSWDVSNVIDMDRMFEGATAFNRDLSRWCVTGLKSEPQDFATKAIAWTEPRPVWGTCLRQH